MKRISIFLGMLVALVFAGPANAQQFFDSSVWQITDSGLQVYQRYYSLSTNKVNPACEQNCPTKPCIADGASTVCQLTYFAGTTKNPNTGFRGYQEDLFNFGAASGSTFNAVFDAERNGGAGNHQGFYAWNTGVVATGTTSAWNTLNCVGTLAGDCLGNAAEANARPQTNVPAASGAVGGSIGVIGGLSPIPVPKPSFVNATTTNVSWDAVASTGKNPGVSPAGYDLYVAKNAGGCGAAPAPGAFSVLRTVTGNSTTVTDADLGISGPTGVYFALKIRYGVTPANPPDPAVAVVSRYLSANSACVAKGGLSANVYELAAKYAGKTNVEVSWKTSLEDGVRGFYVSRATTQNGPYVRVSDLIPAKGEASAYSFIDAIQVPAGTMKGSGLWYKVETIDIDDNAVEYGPTKAQMPSQGNAIIKQRTAKPSR